MHCDGKHPLQLSRFRYHSAIVAAVLEELFRAGLLKVVRFQLRTRNLRSESEDWDPAALAVEEPIDQVKIPGATAAGADRQFPADVSFGASWSASGDHLRPRRIRATNGRCQYLPRRMRKHQIGISTAEVVTPHLTHEADCPSPACGHSLRAHDEL